MPALTPELGGVWAHSMRSEAVYATCYTKLPAYALLWLERCAFTLYRNGDEEGSSLVYATQGRPQYTNVGCGMPSVTK